MQKNLKVPGILVFPVFALAFLLCFPFFQNFLIFIGGKILGRQLNTPVLWIERMLKLSFSIAIVLFSTVFATIKNDFLFKKFMHSKILFAVIIFLPAFFISSYFTSFYGNSYAHGTDSAVFVYIGQRMHSGFVPYRDMFDHKGIYLYFLEFLATSLDDFGIYLLDFCSVFVSTALIYKISRLMCESQSACLDSVLFIFLVSAYPIYKKGGGNLTEYYALPCISWSLYIFIKSLKSKTVSFCDFFCVGITFTIVLLLRVNMVAQWVFFIPFIFVIFLKNKQNSALLRMILGVVSGVIVATLPAVIYFCATKSAKFFWDSYILFNFKYISQETVGQDNVGRLLVAFDFFSLFFIPNVLMIVATLKIYKNIGVVANFLAYLFTFYFVIISGRSYNHYAIILLPFFALPIAILLESLVNSLSNKTDLRKFKINQFCFFGIIILFAAVYCLDCLKIRKNYFSPENLAIVQYLKNNTATDADVLVIGNSVRYNIEAKRFTNQRFFYQTPILIVNKDFFQEFKDSVFLNKPDYIIYPNSTEKSMKINEKYCVLKDLLKELTASYEKIVLEDGIIYKKV